MNNVHVIDRSHLLTVTNICLVFVV